MARVKKVWVLGNMTSAHSRRILEGVAMYGHSQVPPWQIRWGDNLPSIEQARRQGISGSVLFYPSEATREIQRRMQLPMVQTGSTQVSTDYPRVLPDSVAIGRLAARHFLERQYHSFAYIGFTAHLYSEERLQGYQEELGGKEPRVFLHPARPNLSEKNGSLIQFLKELPKRTGIFVANDFCAMRMVEEILEIGLRIPEDLAVLGVDDDPLEVLASPVSLSSVDPDSVELGRRAAMRLDRIMRGEADDGQTELVPPKGVVLRQSTDHWADEDEMVGKALRMIRLESCGDLTVDILCERLGIGRRMFERRFKKVLGKTPEAEMRKVRLDQALEYLGSTTWPVEEIAQKVGYRDPLYFSAAFRKAFGLSPRKWRNLPPEERPASV